MVQNKEKRWRLYMNHYHGKIGGNDKWMYYLVYNPKYFRDNISKIKNINFTNDLGWGYLFYVCNHINKNKIYFEIFEKLLRHPDIDPNLQDNKYLYSPLMELIFSDKINFSAVKLLINHPKTDINLKNISELPVVFFKNSLSNENILDLIFQNPDFDPNIIINGFNIFNIIPKKFHYKILMLPQLILPENLSQEKINIQISFDEYRDFKGIQPLIM